jgi:hypothetical protein
MLLDPAATVGLLLLESVWLPAACKLGSANSLLEGLVTQPRLCMGLPTGPLPLTGGMLASNCISKRKHKAPTGNFLLQPVVMVAMFPL